MKRLFIALTALLLFTAYAEAANRFAVCTTTCTWDASNTGMWSTTSGGATGASVPTSIDTAVLNGSTCVGGTTCTITVNANHNVQSLDFGSCSASTTGCILDFSVNNNNFEACAIDINGGGVRTFKMGSGTFTVTGCSALSTVWNADNASNMTFTPGTSTICVCGSNLSAVFDTAPGLTYNRINMSGFVRYAGGSGTTTVGTLNLIGPASFSMQSLRTWVVSTSFIATTTGSAPISIIGTTQGIAATLRFPSSTTFQWASIKDMDFTGSGSTPVASNSFNIGNNVGITITAPGAGGGGCILGGWLLWRDMPEHLNDNFPAWLDKAG